MSSNIWYPRYIGDYGRKTSHLSILEHGAYTLLLDWVYTHAKPLPANAMQLHRICRAFAPDEHAALLRVLEEFFVLTEAGWVNPRAQEELEKRSDISEKRRKAAQKRFTENNANACANAMQKHTQSQSQSQPQLKKEVEAAVEAYQALACRCGIALVQRMTAARQAKLRARLKDCGGLDGWKAALEKLESSRFCLGVNDKGWKADFDFLLQESSFVKLMEGKYDDRKPTNKGGRTSAKQSIAEQGLELLDDIRAGRID
jgi:uncharacterized protein YdaU (DUF1376 family)